MDGRCPVTELLRDQCAHCRPAPARPAPADEGEYGRPFTATYGGYCAEECGEHIQVGDVIVARTDGAGYAHEGCVP